MALAAIEVARSEFGLEVGRDVSIIGFDDIAMAAWPSHSLTTYSQPIKLMVQRLTSIVQSLLRDPNYPPTATIVPGRLVVRGSARVPPMGIRSEEHTSELQSLMRISYAVFCLKKKKKQTDN